MVIGHTPVDSAFTTYGLLGAGRVLDMLLSLPVLALVFIVALIGLYKAIALSATRASAVPFWTFLVLNVGAFYFFSAVTPLSVGDVQSAAKAAGAKERRTTAGRLPGWCRIVWQHQRRIAADCAGHQRCDVWRGALGQC